MKGGVAIGVDIDPSERIGEEDEMLFILFELLAFPF